MPKRDDEADSTGRREAKVIAPGAPGSKPTWSPAAKSGVGCAISSKSRLWFTLGRGIINEVYHPWVDHAAIRDLGLIITGADQYLSDERSDCSSDTRTAAPGIPAYRVTNECKEGRYRITKQIFADPDRDVLLQKIKFEPLQGTLADFHLYVLTSPRLGDQGSDNCGWVGAFHGTPMLFAQHEGHALALAASAPWLGRSIGYVGESDARLDLQRHGKMTWKYKRADHGHIALAGEIDLEQCGGEFVLAMGISRSPEAAALTASLSLLADFEMSQRGYISQWQQWQGSIKHLDGGKWSAFVSDNSEQRNRPDSSRPLVRHAGDVQSIENADLYRISMMVIRVHRAKQFEGASVASLAIPWGNARGEDDAGGYHLVWPRDLVEESFGLLAGSAHDEARTVLAYLRVTQKPNGGWAQDMWIDGSPYAGGVQLDEAALPILLVDLAHREKTINDRTVEQFWPMVRSAAGFIVRNGPSTGQSRWENTPGISPYTVASEVAALLVAAKMADRFGERIIGRYLRETADLWNDLIEDWTYVTDTPLAKEIGIDGYYIRIAPSPGMRALFDRGENPRLSSSRDLPNSEVLGPDALALVRFGLRAADDPRILNSLKAIDSICCAQTPAGPCWRRYNGGYYGESDTGEPFTGGKDKAGHGRAWPLLTGERGHYELAAGNFEEARRLLSTMNGLASQIGLLPEQVWDSPDLPDRHLFPGRPSGSAMPLAWTHSEYVRLLRSLHDREVFDMPRDSYERYVIQNTRGDLALWRFNHKVESFAEGRRLRIEVLAPAVVHFTTDNWQTVQDRMTCDSGVGFHFADLPTATMRAGETLEFTFRWPASADHWEGRNFHLAVTAR
jgi:glucoamylase